MTCTCCLPKVVDYFLQDISLWVMKLNKPSLCTGLHSDAKASQAGFIKGSTVDF